MYWGAATSAHQVEGGNENDWTDFERARKLELSGRACEHYNRFREDFDIARSLGHNAHRFSIEWSRIEPEEGAWDEREIVHYREVIAALRERNIEPFVSLWHWTVPKWFRDEGGWASKKSPAYFARFVEKVVQEFQEVRFWVTLNEPNVYLSHGYLKGVWPPGRKSLVSYIKAERNLARAHRRAYEIIKNKNQKAQVGIAQNMIYFSRFPALLKRYFWNDRFLKRIASWQDFVGVNYYFSDRSLPASERSDMGWPIDADGFCRVLSAAKKYRKPIYILENGIADAKDQKRAEFIRNHVAAMKKAIRGGADVRGYFYWSLLDNFEWDKGFWPRFGLVEIDYETMKRKIRQSAHAYKKIIEEV